MKLFNTYLMLIIFSISTFSYASLANSQSCKNLENYININNKILLETISNDYIARQNFDCNNSRNPNLCFQSKNGNPKLDKDLDYYGDKSKKLNELQTFYKNNCE